MSHTYKDDPKYKQFKPNTRLDKKKLIEEEQKEEMDMEIRGLNVLEDPEEEV